MPTIISASLSSKTMHLPGLDRLTWEWSRLRARQNKRLFVYEVVSESRAISAIKRSDKKIDLEVISFCGANDFPELVLSMLTFLSSVGVPQKWVVYSDGTLGPEQAAILRGMPFPAVILDWNANVAATSPTDPILLEYAQHHPLGKKYFSLSHHPLTRPFLYADSDLLFYPHAAQALPDAVREKNWFLADIPGASSLDQGLPGYIVNVPHQVNSGLMIFQPGFQWSAGSEYLAGNRGKWGYFAEQTAMHINMLENHASAFDPRLFVISVCDQFHWKDAFRPRDMAARHFVNVVRHRVWSLGWKHHFVSSALQRDAS